MGVFIVLGGPTYFPVKISSKSYENIEVKLKLKIYVNNH